MGGGARPRFVEPAHRGPPRPRVAGSPSSDRRRDTSAGPAPRHAVAVRRAHRVSAGRACHPRWARHSSYEPSTGAANTSHEPSGPHVIAGFGHAREVGVDAGTASGRPSPVRSCPPARARREQPTRPPAWRCQPGIGDQSPRCGCRVLHPGWSNARSPRPPDPRRPSTFRIDEIHVRTPRQVGAGCRSDMNAIRLPSGLHAGWPSCAVPRRQAPVAPSATWTVHRFFWPLSSMKPAPFIWYRRRSMMRASRLGGSPGRRSRPPRPAPATAASDHHDQGGCRPATTRGPGRLPATG